MRKDHRPRTELRPRDLDGISEAQLASHWALYEGYARGAALLEGKLEMLARKGDYGVEFSELKRRAAFEHDGLVLHEHYFGVLKAGQPALDRRSRLLERLETEFGGFASWRKQFSAMGSMRGSGWVILYHDARRDELANYWIDSHEHGHPAGATPILVMDVWEHAYMVDAGADGRHAYVEAFLRNVDWPKVETAFRESTGAVLA